jgi:hypothetical protein
MTVYAIDGAFSESFENFESPFYMPDYLAKGIALPLPRFQPDSPYRSFIVEPLMFIETVLPYSRDNDIVGNAAVGKAFCFLTDAGFIPEIGRMNVKVYTAHIVPVRSLIFNDCTW